MGASTSRDRSAGTCRGCARHRAERAGTGLLFVALCGLLAGFASAQVANGPSPAGETITETFDGRPVTGWECSGGVKVQQAGQAGALICYSPGLGRWTGAERHGSFTLTYKYQHGLGTFVAVLCASDDTVGQQEYRLLLDSDGGAQLVRLSGGRGQQLAAAEHQIHSRTWYDIRIEVADGQIELRVGGRPVLSAHDAQPLPAGGIAFGCTEGSGFACDSISLTPRPVQAVPDIQPPGPASPPAAGSPETGRTERPAPDAHRPGVGTTVPDVSPPTRGEHPRESETPSVAQPSAPSPLSDTAPSATVPLGTTPPVGAAPRVSRPGPIPVAMPEPDSDPLHMTVLTEAAVGDIPLLVTNRDYAYVGGTIGDTSMVASIEVNGRPVAMDGAKFLHKEVFGGPGLYTMRMVAISPHGMSSERTQRVRVIAPSAPEVLERFVVQGAPVEKSCYVSFTVGMGGRIHGEMLVMEVQTSEAALVQRWTHSGPGPTVVNWDGRNAWGEAVLPGEYVGVFALMLGDQLLARIRQPLRVEY